MFIYIKNPAGVTLTNIPSQRICEQCRNVQSVLRPFCGIHAWTLSNWRVSINKPAVWIFICWSQSLGSKAMRLPPLRNQEQTDGRDGEVELWGLFCLLFEQFNLKLADFKHCFNLWLQIENKHSIELAECGLQFVHNPPPFPLWKGPQQGVQTCQGVHPESTGQIGPCSQWFADGTLRQAGDQASYKGGNLAFFQLQPLLELSIFTVAEDATSFWLREKKRSRNSLEYISHPTQGCWLEIHLKCVIHLPQLSWCCSFLLHLMLAIF